MFIDILGIRLAGSCQGAVRRCVETHRHGGIRQSQTRRPRHAGVVHPSQIMREL